MLIQGLCSYYDILSQAGEVLPDGYSKVKIHYMVCLTADGKIDEIISAQKEKEKEILGAKGKVKVIQEPDECEMPKRTEVPGIDANIAEHRPLYLFGLNLAEGCLTPADRTGKAKKSHEAMVERNLDFLDGLDSPVINAYREFLINWNPEEETENEKLLSLGKAYDKSGYAFCLSGSPDKPLHAEPLLKEKWEKLQEEQSNGDINTAQCAVEGKAAPIARIHNKIKGVFGGLATGSVLIGFNNPSECSYGAEQSYNSNISETAMRKYTEALNYLLSKEAHRTLLDDITVVSWAMNPEEDHEDVFNAMVFGTKDTLDAEKTDQMLTSLMQTAGQGKLTKDSFSAYAKIDPDVDFYIVGLKPNSSRLAVKFLYRKKYGELLQNVAKCQNDLKIQPDGKPIPFYRIKKELVSPKSSDKSVDPGLTAKLFEAILYGTAYPTALLETVLRRVRTDTDNRINSVRAGLLKACINRNYAKKEEITMALNKENDNQAYLCGRLFAVLEKMQQEAGNVNRTIKDAYFASASTTPALVFPKLIRLSQNHVNKTKRPVFFNRLMGEIAEKLQDEFPSILSLQDQGRFDIGYYQQYHSFFEKNHETDNNSIETEDK